MAKLDKEICVECGRVLIRGKSRRARPLHKDRGKKDKPSKRK
jgi:hypothetical protein